MSAEHEPQQNHLLAALTPDVQRRLYSKLELVPLKLRQVLYEPRGRAHHVYFPTDSIISVQYLFENGASTAVQIVGNEGLLGLNLLLGADFTPSRSLVQSAGYAYRLPRKRVEEEFRRHGELMMLMLRYTQATITQISQTAVCNRRHGVSEQLCRWLLLSLDRLSDDNLTMTQEFIANMIGVRREGITQAASELRREGVISYSRGKIKVINRPKLEALSCECYEVVRNEIDQLLHYMPQRQVIANPDSISVGKVDDDLPVLKRKTGGIAA